MTGVQTCALPIYRLPAESSSNAVETVGAALFADISDAEQEELLEYLAWIRARRKDRRTDGKG